MFIENLKINNFRNIDKCIFEPSKKINVIFGDNANGKTSLIESIYSVSNLKSFRTLNLSEAINTKSNMASVECSYRCNNSSEVLKININKKSKNYTKNSKKNKLDDYLWSLFSIAFTPDDVFLVNGSPGKRRDLIDRAIFYTDKKYINILKNYYKIIANKNINLKNMKYSEIENWNVLIAKYSSLIVSLRNKYIDRLNFIFKENTNKFIYDYEISKENPLSLDDLRLYFTEELKKNFDKEKKYKYSIIGAHKQNIDFSIDKKNLKIFGSQGQKRSFVLLFKSSQIVDFENIHSFVPILLLDDMASELDQINKNNFFNILENFSGQTFITTTDSKLFLNSEKVKYFRVEDGNINSFS